MELIHLVGVATRAITPCAVWGTDGEIYVLFHNQYNKKYCRFLFNALQLSYLVTLLC